MSIISFTHLELSRLHLNSVETIIFINHPHHIVSNVYVWTKYEETIDIPPEHLKASRVNYPNNCCSLALKPRLPALEGKRIQQLFLQIGSLENHAVEIQQECDDQFLRKLMSGLTPVWMTEDFDQVSTDVFDENGTFGELLLTFFLNRYFHPSTSRCLV